MKRITLLLVSLGLTLLSYSQKRVNWSYFAKKITDKTYEVHLIAEMDPGWYIYAQKQPENSIAIATSIAFAKSPLISLSGVPVEKGKLERKKYESLGIESLQYHNTVDFVQTITVKAKVKTNIEGTITFQVCNADMCMPPDVSKFSLFLQ